VPYGKHQYGKDRAGITSDDTGQQDEKKVTRYVELIRVSSKGQSERDTPSYRGLH